MVVQTKWMSEDQHNLLGVGVAPTEVEKLVPNLRNKDRHVLYYRNLQLYTYLSMRLTRVHRSLWFDQSPWMEPYIRMNTELRKKAASDFEKDLHKLMNNSVFGKTMDNLRKRVDVKLVRSHEEDKLRRLIASTAFARANIFDDDLAAIQVHKSTLVLNRRCMWDWAFWISPSTRCTNSITTSSKRSTERAASSSTRTQTAFSLRSRPRMCTRTWPRTKLSMTHPTTPGPPSVQLSQQEGSGKVERRVRRPSKRRVCWPAPKMYSIIEAGGKKKDQEG